MNCPISNKVYNGKKEKVKINADKVFKQLSFILVFYMFDIKQRKKVKKITLQLHFGVGGVGVGEQM